MIAEILLLPATFRQVLNLSSGALTGRVEDGFGVEGYRQSTVVHIGVAATEGRHTVQQLHLFGNLDAA